MESLHPVAPNAPRGFTLVEMMVVLAIIVIVTVIALSGQGNFNKSLTVTDTAYTVALSIRQAQSYGLASRIYGAAANSGAGYGMHFAASSSGSYLMFVDTSKAVYAVPSYCPVGTAGQPDAKPGNCLYDPNQNEVVQNYAFSRGFTITQLCGHDSGGTLRCSSDSTAPLTGIDVIFIRPNTNSVVTGLRSTGNIQLKDAQIKLTAPVGNGSRYICVTQVGEISVAATACP